MKRQGGPAGRAQPKRSGAAQAPATTLGAAGSCSLNRAGLREGLAGVALLPPGADRGHLQVEAHRGWSWEGGNLDLSHLLDQAKEDVSGQGAFVRLIQNNDTVLLQEGSGHGLAQKHAVGGKPGRQVKGRLGEGGGERGQTGRRRGKGVGVRVGGGVGGGRGQRHGQEVARHVRCLLVCMGGAGSLQERRLSTAHLACQQERKTGRRRRDQCAPAPPPTHLMMVRGPEHSSKRMEKPTSSPRPTSISSATRRATLIAATRRGCVHTTFLPSWQ